MTQKSERDYQWERITHSRELTENLDNEDLEIFTDSAKANFDYATRALENLELQVESLRAQYEAVRELEMKKRDIKFGCEHIFHDAKELLEKRNNTKEGK